MFQNDLDKMSAVLARTWNYLSGLGQEPGWAVWQLSKVATHGLEEKYKWQFLLNQANTI